MDRKAARESFVSLPEVLRKQVLLLNAISIAGVLLALLTYIAMGDRIFSLGVAGIAFFGMASV